MARSAWGRNPDPETTIPSPALAAGRSTCSVAATPEAPGEVARVVAGFGAAPLSLTVAIGRTTDSSVNAEAGPGRHGELPAMGRPTVQHRARSRQNTPRAS